MSGEHTPEATLYECGALENADLYLMSGPASWVFLFQKVSLEVSTDSKKRKNKDQVESGSAFKISR